MSEYIYLQGSEGVERAGGAMSAAGDEMYRAAGSISQSVDDLRQILDQFLCDLRDIVQKEEE